MKSYDWIIIGAGLTGAALGYELTRQGASVLILGGEAPFNPATRYSYGGVAYWAGKTELMRQLGQKSRQRYHDLTAELEYDIQFREVTLLLPVFKEQSLEVAANIYANCEIPPHPISVTEACQIEPLLNPEAIEGALVNTHGHVNPECLLAGFQQACIRLGGQVVQDPVTQLNLQNKTIHGVSTSQTEYYCKHVVVCAGGFSRQLLQHLGIKIRMYFTHAEILEITHAPVHLQTFISPALVQRIRLEERASEPALDHLWDHPGHEPAAAILDPGAVQFSNGLMRLGQTSRVLTNPLAALDPQAGEQQLRESMRTLVPALADCPGTWHQCCVAFSRDHLPIVGAIKPIQGLFIFSAFSNPFAMVLPLAQRFAATLSTNRTDPTLDCLSPDRFTTLHSFSH